MDCYLQRNTFHLILPRKVSSEPYPKSCSFYEITVYGNLMELRLAHCIGASRKDPKRPPTTSNVGFILP